MANNWVSFLALVDSEPASIFVDLGIAQIAPVHTFDHLAYVRLQMLKPRDDGLSSQDEFDQLLRVEDKLLETTLKDSQTMYVGRNTSAGSRDFYFYTKDFVSFERDVAGAMAAFPNYFFMTGSRPDPSWQAYFEFLYPSAAQLDRIKNNATLESLKSHGDKLLEPRVIEFFVYFSELADREAFNADVCQQGFTLKLAPVLIGPNGYEAVIAKTGRPIDIDDMTSRLMATVQAYRGNYDGWECPVIV